jgi:pimeloyl-ACP methyl ester carboxylesterase
MLGDLKRLIAGDLEVAYQDVGPTNGDPVILLHGFPYDIHTYEDVVTRLSAAGHRCIVPYLRGYGATRFRHADTPRSGQQAALGADLLALMDALEISSAIIAGYDWGGRAACIVAALWPDRVRGLVSGGGYAIQNIASAHLPVEPEYEQLYWYQYYFHSERGRQGLSANRDSLCRLLWRIWSPLWQFDDATYSRTAAAFENPDFVEIVIHSYRHRFGLVSGDQKFDAIEARLAELPLITVPTIVLRGDSDGVDPATAVDNEAPFFSGPYELQRLAAVGHNIPQEAPDAFAEAVLALA